MPPSGTLTAARRDELLALLESRFEKHPERHEGIEWSDVRTRLEKNPSVLATLAEMERTEGEPDVTGQDEKGRFLFIDCSVQSPKGRRSLCFDPEAWTSRKANKPAGSAMELASEMGIELLTEEEYRALQELGDFDTTTSSWVQTPARIRERGGAMFCDRRYDTVWTYHNGAESYYAARGFRGVVRV